MSRRIFAPVAIAGIVTAMKAAAQTSIGVKIYDRSTGGVQLNDIATVASGDNPGDNYPNGVIQVGINGIIPNFVGPDEITTVYFDYPGMVSRASLAADRAVTQGDTASGGLAAGNNLSDVASAATSRSNLGLGTAAVISATAGGDLSGNLPSPTVAKVNGIALTGTPSVGYVPTATSSSTATWQAAAGAVTYWFLGDGTDGAGSITGGTTTLTRDMHYTTLTVSSSGILIPNGWRIFCRGAVTVASGGAIHMDGGDGVGGAGGARPGTNQAPLCQGSAGVNASQTGAGNAASAVVGGANSLGGTGGAGGASGANAGGTTVALGGTFAAVPYLNAWKNHATLALGHPVWTQTNNVASSVPIAGGGGGGGGANDGTGATGAGGSGAGGGVMILNALTVTNSGRISANGGVGGNGSSRNGAGGGGGGGGVVFVNTTSFTGTQPTATGGTGGTPFGTGSAGVDGSPGTVHVGLI